MLAHVEVTETIDGLRAGVFSLVVRTYVPAESVEEQWDLDGLTAALRDDWGLDAPVREWAQADQNLNDEDILTRVAGIATRAYAAKVEQVGRESWTSFERSVMLQAIDQHWREHLAALDHLRQGIHLRGYAQKNPKQEYKREAFEMFSSMLERVKHDTISILSKIQIRRPEDVQAVEPAMPDPSTLKFQHAPAPSLAPAPPAPEPRQSAPARASAMRPPPAAEPVAPYVREAPKVGRNDPCPCGSGQRFKHCHGRGA